MCGRQRADIGGLEGSRPAPERGGPRAAQPGRVLRSAHAGVKHLRADRAAVVVHEHHEGVALDAPLLQLREQPAHVVVDVGDHAEELRHVRAHFAGVELLVFLGHLQRGVRSVAGEIGVERPLALHGPDPLERLVEEDVRAIALRLLELAVVEDGRVEIGVARRVAATAREGLADAAAAVDEHLVEARAGWAGIPLHRPGAICRRCPWHSRRPGALGRAWWP